MRFILPLLILITVVLAWSDRSQDRQLFLWINTGIPHALPVALSPFWDTAMIVLTDLGDTHVMLWIILLVNLPWWMQVGRKNPEAVNLYWVVFAIVVVLATVIAQGLKSIVGALRPASVLPPESLHILGNTLNYNSFPSGHTVTAFVGMCTLLPIIPASWRWFALTLAASIGFSRVGMGAHWPIDVAAGAFLGIVASMVSWQTAFWLQKKTPPGNTFWKKTYRGLALLGMFIMAANIAYTPFYELDHRYIRLGLIGLCLAAAIIWGYRRQSRSN